MSRDRESWSGDLQLARHRRSDSRDSYPLRAYLGQAYMPKAAPFIPNGTSPNLQLVVGITPEGPFDFGSLLFLLKARGERP